MQQEDPTRRLGERMLAQGWVSPQDLQAALAFRLGIPLADLWHLPVDKQCARTLPMDIARRVIAIPIMASRRRPGGVPAASHRRRA